MKKLYYISLILALFFIALNVYSQYPNRQVTGNPYDQSETAIAVSPLNNMNIIGVRNVLPIWEMKFNNFPLLSAGKQFHR